MITYEETKQLLLEAVDERGYDFEYPAEWSTEEFPCLYRRPDDQGPACIVGWVADRWGVLELLLEGRSAVPVLHTANLVLDHDALDLLELAQSNQDNGYTWGDAVHMAIQRVEERGHCSLDEDPDYRYEADRDDSLE